MSRDTVIAILGILRTAYPRFYSTMAREDAEKTIELWQEMFKDMSPQVVTAAVKSLINSFSYPPTIADVKNEIYKLTSNEKTAIELWNELKSACRSGIYGSQAIFPNLSKEIQLFLKNPMQLKELAVMDSETLNTVVKGQFLKQIEIIQKREKENVMMLPETKNFIKQLEDKMKNTKMLKE